MCHGIKCTKISLDVLLELIEFLIDDEKANRKHKSEFSKNVNALRHHTGRKTDRNSCPDIPVRQVLQHTPCLNMCRTKSQATISDFSELEYKILMKCLECLLEIKLPHNKIGSILVLLDTLDCEIDEIRETSNKLKAKYAAVFKLIEDGEFSQHEQKDFVLLRISTVTVSSVKTTTTTITEQTASTA